MAESHITNGTDLDGGSLQELLPLVYTKVLAYPRFFVFLVLIVFTKWVCDEVTK